MNQTLLHPSQVEQFNNYDSKFFSLISPYQTPSPLKEKPVLDQIVPSLPSYSSVSSPASLKDVKLPIAELRSNDLPVIHSGTILDNFEAKISEIDVDSCEGNGESAFFVCDLANVMRQLTRWRNQFGGLIEPFFAVKCNPDPLIIALFAKLGIGFDCASQTEISSVLANGVDPDRIIYANPCKAASFIRNAAKAGVKKMTFDNGDELVKVKKFYPSAKLVLRILTDDSESLCRLGLKFGAKLDDVEKLLIKAKELELEVIGVSFHVGSGCGDPLAFDDALRRAAVTFEIAKKVGYDFDFLDIGGGFNDDPQFETTCDVIRRSLEKYFPGNKVADREGNVKGLEVIAEPGRYFVSRAFELAANIIARRKKNEVDLQAAKKHCDVADEQTAVMYYINDGVYGAFNCIIFDHQIVHPIPLTVQGKFVGHVTLDESRMEASSVWGPTCDGIDLVSPQAKLPRDIGVGDWMRFENLGAYSICAASNFNGFSTSTVRYTIDAKGEPGLEAKIRALLD